ncbi:MAG: aldo/keto reductase [Halioglobus sp.]|nr:aldo/keto reductase [Halioglobus sp.]
MINRRQALQFSAALLAYPALRTHAAPDLPVAAELPLIQRAIPSSGELLPVMGMGTSRTFDTAGDPESLATLTEVMQLFFAGKGKVIDSSPMYGNAETRVGDVLRAMKNTPPLFAATKVWTSGEDRGIAQMEESAKRMDIRTFDLIAVHNLKDWKTQLATLKAWKADGRVRYIGITTSHGRDHAELMEVMRNEPLDFVQFSYNIEDREAEQALLPLAQDRGIATMINRPYQRGALFGKSHDQPLPAIAAELDCSSWAQFFLKYILGHPAVTCIIPATAVPRHMADNMRANFGRVPDSAQREEMLRIFKAL